MSDDSHKSTNDADFKKNQKRIMDWRIGLAGAFLFLFSVCWFGYYIYMVSTYTYVTATVVSVKTISSSSSNGPSRTYSPIIRFKHGNSMITREPGFSSGQFNFDTGEKIPVIYNPTDTMDFRIITFMAFWSWPTIGMLVGLGIIGIARSIR